MKVEFAQLAGRDNGTAYNLERALAAIAACAADTQLIVFPETHLMGFPSAETVADIAEPVAGPTVQAVIQAARARNISVVVGMAERDGGHFYNTTLLITPDGIALRYRKSHLWASDRGVFTPGDRYATCLWNGVRVGLLICYDIEFPETARALAQDDPNYNVLFRPPESHNPHGLLTAADAILGHLIVAPTDDPATKTAKAARIAKFVGKGLPTDFAARLVADRSQIDDAHETENDADNDGVENTAAISRLVDEGMKECNSLDAIFHNVYTHNADKLTAWLSASHLQRVAKHAAAPAPPPTPKTNP